MLWDSPFYVVNNITLIVLGIAVIMFPAWVLIFYCRNFAKWEDEGFENKYGAVFEGLRKDRRSSLAYPVIFILRRMLLVFISTVTKEHFFIQLFAMVLISMSQVAYLV